MSVDLSYALAAVIAAAAIGFAIGLECSGGDDDNDPWDGHSV